MKKIFLALLVLSSFSCSNKLFGTNTGNPDQGGQGDDSCSGKSRCMPTPYVHITVGIIGEKITSCGGADIDNSEAPGFEMIMNQPGLNLELPVKEISFFELNQKYNLKKINVDMSAISKCFKAIQDLDCNSVVFQNAYDINDQMNFANVHKIFRAEPACLISFADKE